MYDYWQTSFGRDSWDGTGGWMFAKAAVDHISGGQATPDDVDEDRIVSVAHAMFGPGFTSDWLIGHEEGHLLQQGALAGTYLTTTSFGFHATGGAAMEHNADVHGWHYQNTPIPTGVCSDPLHHYTRLRTDIDSVASNKHIGNCHAWLMSQTSIPGGLDWYGVSVTPMARATYDQIWYRALTLYFTGDDSYFDWWNSFETAAHDLYGFSAPYYGASSAARSIGSWTGFGTVGSGIRPDDRYPAVGWAGAPKGPCVFYRYSGSTTAILYQCYTPTGWTTAAQLNDLTVDPAASEPTATYRYEAGGTYIYVLWRGTDDRIHYRRLDVGSLTVGPAQDLGASHLTAAEPAAASIYESVTSDRLVVVYHPLAHPTWFYSTYLGSAAAPTDLGPAFDSDVPPSLVAYPYWNRIYFIRPNFNTGSSPRHLQYASHTVTGSGPGSWSSLTDLTALYNLDTRMPNDIVRTDRGVALAEYNRSAGTPRLRMAFTTLTGELWYSTLRETSPGVLGPDGYRAVPLAPVTGSSSQSAGGLAPGTNGFPLWHFWGQGSPSPKLFEWRTYSD